MDTGVLPRPVSLVGGVDKPSKIKAFGTPGIGENVIWKTAK